MRKSVIAFLTMLTLALGIAPAFALAAEPGGGLSAQGAGETYTVHFMNGSTELTTAEVEYDKTIKDVPAAAAKIPGYKATAWTAADGSKFTFGDDTTGTKVTTDLVLTGTFEADTYKIAYDATAVSSLFEIDPNDALTEQTLTYLEKVGGTGADKDDYKSITLSNLSNTMTEVTTADGKKLYVDDKDSNKNFGYIFTGWNTKSTLDGTHYDSGASIASDQVTADVTLYIEFQKVYKVTFTPERGTVTYPSQLLAVTLDDEGAEQAVYATEPTPKPETDHYTWKGWKNGSADYDFTAKVTENLALNGSWEIQKVEVTYVTNVEGYTKTSEKVDYKTALTPTALDNTHKTTVDGAEKDVAWKEGYTFAGWYSDPELKTAWVDNTAVMDDTVLYAKWAPITYTVHFNAVDGEATGTTGDTAGEAANKQSVEYDKATKLASNGFALEDNVFLGWATSEARAKANNVDYQDGQEVTSLTSDSTKDFELYAVWQPSYKVIFKAEDETSGTSTGFAQGTDPETYKTTYEQTIPVNKQDATLKTTQEMALVNPNYKFDKWVNEADATLAYEDGEAFVSTAQGGAAATLKATWTPKTYKVSYDLNDGEGTAPADQYMKYGVGKADKDGNWLDGDGKVVTTGGVDKLVADAGTGITRTGYKLTGWAKKADATVVDFALGGDITNKALTGDTPLYAVWAANTYKVEFDLGGATTGTAIDPQTGIVYGSDTKITVPALTGLEKTGATLVGNWVDAEGNVYEPGEYPSTTFTKDTKLTVNWKADELAVTFYNFDGGDPLDEQTVEYGKAPEYKKGVAHENPTYADPEGKYDYKFFGWYSEKETEATEDTQQQGTYKPEAIDLTKQEIKAATSYYAMYTRTLKQFTVKFDYAGVKPSKELEDVTASKATEYGETFAEPAKLETADEGYAFAGWRKATFDAEGNQSGVEDVTFPVTLTENLVLVANWAPTEATKAAADEAAAKATEQLASLAQSENGKDVASDQKYVSPEEYQAIQSAIAAYNAAAEAGTLSSYEIKALEDAKAAADNASTGTNEGKATASEAAQSTALKAAKAALEDENLPADAKTALEAAIKTAEDAGAGAMTNAEVQTLKDATTVATQAAAEAGQAAAKTAQDAADKAADAAKTAAAKAASTKKEADYKAAQEAYEAAAKAAEAAQKAAQSAAVSAAAAGDLGSAEKLNQQAAAAGVAAQSASNAATSAKSSAAAAKKAATAKKANNPMKVKQAKKAIKAKANKKTTVKGVLKITGAKGKVTVKTNNKKVKVTKAGKVTVKKGLKKATTVKITITAAGDNSYNKATKTLKLKVKVSKK